MPHNRVFLFVCFCFLTMLTACRSSWARDQTRATEVTSQVLNLLSHQGTLKTCTGLTRLDLYVFLIESGRRGFHHTPRKHSSIPDLFLFCSSPHNMCSLGATTSGPSHASQPCSFSYLEIPVFGE